MKTKGKNILKIFTLIIIFSIIVSWGKVFAEDYYTINKSPQFEQWESLSDEERKNCIQPEYNDLTITDSVKRSTYSSLVGGTSTLESKYSLLDNQNITVKNQQRSSLCWAFSFCSIMETNVIKKYGINLEYSPIYTDYMVSKMYNRRIGKEGNFNMALANAVSGNGAVYELELPFLNYYDESKNPQETTYLSYNGINVSNLNSKVKIIKSINFANIYKNLDGNKIEYIQSNSMFNSSKYTEQEVLSIREKIKKHIKNYGAVFSLTRAGWDLNSSLDFNNETNSYYSNISIFPDHAITIIGWDDNYSKKNFRTDKQPIHDGAYIVLNSWGKDFGNKGCYYISYDDAYIEQSVSGIVDMQEFSKDSDKGYDNIYQYDELGPSYFNIFVNDNYTKRLSEGYLANVFTRKDTNKREVISEIGVYIPVTEGIEVYVDNENGDMKDYGQKVASYTGSEALEPGYHTLKLSSPIEVTGEKFSVIIKYINQEDAIYPLECNIKESGLANEDLMFYNAKAEYGQSYISTDGNNWTDINKYQMPKNSTEFIKYQNTNACIKAFTTILTGSSTIPVSQVSLNKTETILEEGKTEILAATITPSNATNKNITWKSSNESVATINGGIITAKKAGETIITITTLDGNKTAQCKVTVKAKEPEIIKVQSISLNKGEINLVEGTTGILTATITPNNATNKNITWKSSNESVATISGGVVTAKATGETTITVTTVDGTKTAQCKVTVTKKAIETIAVQSISLNKTVLNMEEGTTETLIPTITPSNATNKNINWTSSNENVATINGGIITAKKVGEITITVTTVDGNKTAQCKVTINAKAVAVQSVNLNKTTLTLEKGTTETLIVTIAPSDATNKNIRWSSSNETVATINDGVITAKGAGETTITVTTVDGKKTAQCKVVVAGTSVISINKVILNKNKETIEVGDEINLVVTIEPSNATNQNVVWSSLDETVATISKSGIITGIKEGTTTIKVISEDGKKEASCELTVTKKTNTDDDIYKEDPYKDENEKTNVDKDNTKAKQELPDTGTKIVLIIILIIFIFTIVKFVRYKILRVKEK